MAVQARGASQARRQAVASFLRGGCVRTPSAERREEGYDVYKKGWEVRFYADSRTEAARLREVLREAGLRPGRAYRKRPRRWIVPLYGRGQVETFLGWVQARS